jgi:hypothetical protein
MSGESILLPRQLTKLEVIDIHILVKSTRPILRPFPKVEPCEPRR